MSLLAKYGSGNETSFTHGVHVLSLDVARLLL